MTALVLPLAESAELVLLRDSARGLLQEAWPAERAAAGIANPHTLIPVWQRAAAQGWTALASTNDEFGLAAAIVLMEDLGRSACPLPLMDSVLANAVLEGNPTGTAASLLARIQAGEAIVSWVFGPHGGDVNAFELTVGPTLDGHAAFVESAAIATHFLIVTGRPGEIAIVPRGAAGLTITPTPGLDEPPLSHLKFARLDSFELIDAVSNVDILAPLARLLLAARATGSAGYGLERLCEYARLRTQFGKPIGQYQAIAHKLADCFTHVEICRLSLLAAGRAAEERRAFSAAVAATHAGHLLRQVVLQLHHGFGGVSFWDEHELPRHFRRIHGDVTRLGGVQQARRDLATIVLNAGAMPDIALTPAADAFRAAADPLKPVAAPVAEGVTPRVDLGRLEDASDRLTASATAFDAALAAATLSPDRRTRLNATLRDIDQLLLTERGLPTRPWYRNLVYAPGKFTGYGAKTLPGVREAIEERRFADVALYAGLAAGALDAYAARLDAATAIVAGK